MDALDDLDAVAAVIPCADIADTIAGFERLGFRLDTILPADDPAVAIVSGHGLRLRLQRDASAPPTTLAPLAAKPFVGRAGEGEWSTGRAGMRYRDLVPDRLGGHLVASQIRIDDAGPVPDYVHWHAVQLQLIYCHRGSVRVVYEDQGAPFELLPGDCVLQPPGIRHRVLECSAGLEVIELGVPAVHPTHVDHVLALPTAAVRPERRFGEQRFVRHQHALARWAPAGFAGFEARDLGIAEATAGLADVRVLRPTNAAPRAEPRCEPEAAFVFAMVLRGSIALRIALGPRERLGGEDVCVVPGGCVFELAEPSADLELLELVLRRR